MKSIKIDEINTEELHFDVHNPRLAEFNITNDTPEEEILKLLWDAMAVDEIVLSIAASGFFQHEPLIAVKEKVNRQDKVVVIEGNRRLAAVKTILHPNLFDELQIHNPRIAVSKPIKLELKTLPVIIVNSREDAWKFIGFKHINGPSKWGSFAKAKYISQIHNEFKVPLSDIAVQIGDTNKTVLKLYQGLKVLELAEKFKVFSRTDITGNRLYFSHLYTGLGYEGVKKYIGFSENPKDIERPIKPEKKEELGNLLTWMFGSKRDKIEPVIRSQNPDLKRLDAVLKKKESVVALKNGTPLAVAYEMSQAEDEVFEESLVFAKQSLQKAHSYWTMGYNGQLEPLKMVGSIANLAESLYESMEQKYSEKKSPQSKKRISED